MKRGAGLSLLEVVVATSLLSLVAILVLNLFPSVILGMHRSHLANQAERVAHSELSRARLASFTSHIVGSVTTLPVVRVNGVEFTPELRVEAPSQGAPQRLKVLKVVVSWSERGRDHQVTREVWVSRVQR